MFCNFLILLTKQNLSPKILYVGRLAFFTKSIKLFDLRYFHMKSCLKENYNHTLYACFIGYIIQAIVNNFVPLLFLTFQREYDISLEKISLLITFNFGIQLLVDFLAAGLTD